MKKIFFSMFFFLAALLFFPLLAHAVGISPSIVEISDMSPNSEIQKEISISRSDAAKKQTFQITLEGEIAPYIVLSTPYGKFDMAEGEQDHTYSFLVQSKNLAEGTYRTKINVSPVIEAGGEAVTEGTVSVGSTIVSGSQAEIQLSITNQTIESYTINEVTMNDAEEGQVIGFSYLFANTGNVDARPKSIEFSATDELDATNTYQETLPKEKLKIVPAFATERVDVQTNAKLRPALYTIVITFRDKDDNAFFVSDSLRLQVFPVGTLAQKGELLNFVQDKPKYQNGEIVKFLGTFKNTGTVDLSTALAVEIFLNDQRLEIVKSEPRFVPVNQQYTLEATYRPQKEGKYRAVARASYGPHETESLETVFEVTQLPLFLIFGVLTGATVLLGIIIFWLHRRKRTTQHSLQ